MRKKKRPTKQQQHWSLPRQLLSQQEPLEDVKTGIVFEQSINETLSKCTIHLFTNEWVDLDNPDFIEPLGDEGYGAKPFGQVGTPVEFTLFTPWIKIYGYFVMDWLGRTLFYERFKNAPLQILKDGGSFSITPTFNLAY